ncbi:MAG: phosphoribosylamine--glycine ligase [Dehalococcoidales bacterium]|nr:phosphoribosylamine--glycine ligase [Dehalococcoidales bacterium]
MAQSPRVTGLYAAPGNAGTAAIATNVALKAEDVEGLLAYARDNKIDLTVIGPENPLSEGIVDRFQAAGLRVFGPTRAAAEIESSKVFSVELMEKHAIPCAKNTSFSDYEQAVEYIRAQQPPIVLKADGLAAGKGVIISPSIEEAEKALAGMMQDSAFGAAGNRVVIQEHLHGREMSYFVFTDGRNVLPTVPACDYKRIYEGNKGPNTGGMGSYSPPPFFTGALGTIIMKTIMEPAILALADEGRPYTGTLYGGLFIENNMPKVIEFNASLGDPETQVVLPRLKTDLIDIIEAALDKKLDTITLEWTDEACVGVVMASGGYPGSYETGFPIYGLDAVDDDIIVFHAGTRPGENGEVLTSGGRVLTVVALGKDLEEARDKVYKNTSRISFEGCRYRTDIADLK